MKKLDATNHYLEDLSCYNNFGQDITFYHESDETVEIINTFVTVAVEYINNHDKYKNSMYAIKDKLFKGIYKVFKDNGYKMALVGNEEHSDLCLFLQNISEAKAVLDYSWYYSMEGLFYWFEEELSEEDNETANQYITELHEYIGNLSFVALKNEIGTSASVEYL